MMPARIEAAFYESEKLKDVWRRMICPVCRQTVSKKRMVPAEHGTAPGPVHQACFDRVEKGLGL